MLYGIQHSLIALTREHVDTFQRGNCGVGQAHLLLVEGYCRPDQQKAQGCESLQVHRR